MCVKPKCLRNIEVPAIYLNRIRLPLVESYKYLGAILNDDMTDDADIRRHVRALYCRGNILTKNFRKCTREVKNKLFATYCSSSYGSSLWSTFSPRTYSKAVVGYNDIYRQLFDIRRGESMTAKYRENELSSFNDIVRSSAESFRGRITRSFNTILYTITHSAFFINSSMVNSHWKKIIEREQGRV